MKKHIFTAFVILSLTLIFSISCNKIDLNPKKFQSKDFPVSLGSYWEYQHLDKINSLIDTLTASVVAQNVSLGELDNLWKLEWRKKSGELVETEYLDYNSDSISFYTNSSPSGVFILTSKYVFPFKVNDTWGSNKYFGDYEVVETGVASDDYGLDYGQGFLCTRTANPGLTFIKDQSLLVKNIGLVWRENYVHLESHEIFSLIDFQIK